VSRKGQSITLSISERDKAQLEALAMELGMLWGDRPNISKLVEAIARRQLLIAPNNDWTESRIKALAQAVDTLTDTGKILEAQAIADLLLERSELPLPLRSKIERFLGNPPPPWRLEIDRYIYRQQPFELSYQDAANRLWSFTIRYAKITPHEQRQYLDCWCEETEGNQDVPKLQHNWSLRLDRIPEAAIVPIEGEWHPNLEQLDVEIHLLGDLAFAYQAKPEDITDGWLPGSQRVRRIVRQVAITFWFIREILRYTPDCVIVSPESVRDRLRQKVRPLYTQYDITIEE